jgi:hypothetical protein
MIVLMFTAMKTADLDVNIDQMNIINVMNSLLCMYCGMWTCC